MISARAARDVADFLAANLDQTCLDADRSGWQQIIDHLLTLASPKPVPGGNSEMPSI